MVEQILSIVLIIVLIISIIFVVKKRKKAGITGLKSALTQICFFLISIICLFAYWFKYTGLIIWVMNGVLLIMAAFFTKYMPRTKK